MLLIKAPDFFKTVREEIRPDLSEEQKNEFYEKLSKMAKNGAAPKKTDKAFHIAGIIETAFNSKLSFEQFEELASCAGYKIRSNRLWPPYYLLKIFLDAKSYDYEAFKNELVDKDNIKFYIEHKIVSFESFSYRIKKNYYDYKDSYNTSFRMAIKTEKFQTEFLCFFFNHQYIEDDLYKILFSIDEEADKYQYMHFRFCGANIEFIRQTLTPENDGI